MCPFDIKKEDRNCKYCTVIGCSEREGVVLESVASTSAKLIPQNEQQNTLTWDDMSKIVDIYDEVLKESYETGVPEYESRGMYEEVLRRFNEQKNK